MSVEVVTILVLVAMFVIATLLPINMGALGLVAAFVVGTWTLGMEADEILAGFPGDLFVTLVGITYLFAIASNNGTIDWLVQLAVRAVRGRIAAIPWVMFAVAALLTAFGAVSPGAVAIVAPIALGFAAKYKISPLLMGLMVVHGAQGGGFSPISIYGGIVNQVVERNNLESSPITLFLGSLGFNLAVSVVIFFVLGGRALLGRRESVSPDTERPETRSDAERVSERGGSAGTTTSTTVRRAGVEQVLTVVGLVALAVAALVFDLDVGLVAITVAVVLAVAFPKSQKGAVDKISWSTVLLIGGVITYVGVLETAGTIEYVSNGVAGIGAPLIAALLLCYIGAIVSAFASSVGVLGALIPLAVPFLLQGDIGAVGMIVALSISSTMVDVSPFSTNGALVLANAQGIDKDRFFRQLMGYGGIIVLAAPVLTWLVLIVPGWL